MKHYNIPVFISHYGCPYECAFCNQKKINGVSTNIKKGDISNIIEEHLNTLPKNSRKELAFFGGTFTGIAINEQIEFLNEVKGYIDKGYIEGVRVSTRPDYISEEKVNVLKKYGVKAIELGVQSFNDIVLQASNRTYKKDVIYNAAELIKKHNIELGLQIMPGLPKSTFEIEMENIKHILNIAPDTLRVYPTLVIEGTKLENWYKDGLYKPLSLEEAASISAIYIAHMELNKIKLIKVGLQASDDLRSEGVVVAGPFHPAFRELAEGKIYLNALSQLKVNTDKIKIKASERTVSKIKGIKKINENLLGKKIEVEIDESLKNGDFLFENELYSRRKVLKKIISECE